MEQTSLIDSRGQNEYSQSAQQPGRSDHSFSSPSPLPLRLISGWESMQSKTNDTRPFLSGFHSGPTTSQSQPMGSNSPMVSVRKRSTMAKNTPLQAPAFLCELCMTSFYSESDLLIHERSVYHKGLYHCRWCSCIFKTKEERNEHVRLKHVDGSMFVDICIPCGKGFKSRMGYNNHMKMYHTKEGEVQTYKCEVCGKSCATRSQLNVHMRSHSDQQNYFCVTCNKAFKHKFNLQRHNCPMLLK